MADRNRSRLRKRTRLRRSLPRECRIVVRAKIKGGEIRRRRTKLGMTTTELARAVGVSQAQVSRVENGVQGTRVPTLKRIARVLRVPWTRLVTVIGLSGHGPPKARKSDIPDGALDCAAYVDAARSLAALLDKKPRTFAAVSRLLRQLAAKKRRR